MANIQPKCNNICSADEYIYTQYMKIYVKMWTWLCCTKGIGGSPENVS